MLVYWETGSEGAEQIEAVTWTILNSQAERNGSIEGLLRSSKYHASARLEAAASGHGYKNGDSVPRSSLNEEDFSNAVRNFLSEDEDTAHIVNEVIESYNNNEADPTGGSRYFIHVPYNHADWYIEGIKALAVKQGVDDRLFLDRIDGLSKVLIFNNLIAPPYEEDIQELEANSSQ